VKFTLSWLKDHLDTDADAGRIAERLTMIGHEVEQVLDRGAGLAGLVVAEIVETAPHPNADKLRLCTVETGSGRLQVVCGAPNARTGLKSVFAPVGATIPAAGTPLKRATIRGVESTGMLLSARELNLSEDHLGIVELAADAPAGSPAAAALGLADPVVDVSVTPNRSDCLGVRGLARDLAAAGLGRLKPLRPAAIAERFPCPVGVELRFEASAATACPYFVGRLIRGVRNRESPAWLKDRLAAVGSRPISALVDITNYLTFDLCRPLHVFDAEKLAGGLTVRLGRPGEMLAALDGRTYALDDQMTVIADDAGPAALGGVIGGERTACTEATTAVFVESALFDPVRTARTGRALNILSDARFRFERGIDPSFLVRGLDIATAMILELCGGEASSIVVAGVEPPRPAPIRLRPERIGTLTGVTSAAAEAAAILERLGFGVDTGAASWTVAPPPWRTDIDGEACLVEEVVRIFGYDHIPTTPLPRPAAPLPPALTAEQRRRGLVRRVLAGRGLVEAVTLSFMATADARPFGGGDPALTLTNPISADLDVMRPSILPNLLRAAGLNADRGIRDVALFEVGPQYSGTAAEAQAWVASGVRTGRAVPRHWAVASRPVDAFDTKADACAVLETLGADPGKLTLTRDAPSWYHPGRSGVVRLGPKTVLAAFGEVHPGVLAHLGIRAAVAGFEVFLDAVPPRKVRRGASRPPLALPPFQPIERDFAFVVDAAVPAEAVVAAVRTAEPALIADVSVFDVFAGGALGDGKKSLAVSVVLQPTDRTPTDAEIDAVGDRIVESVARATGGALRT
jgi:phenylalanyl-tRNA synthetase beta chain